MSANMQVAAKGVTEVNASLNEIAGSAKSVDEATRKVKEASRALA
jgi:methyl-accepting chemotaxis protein